MAGIPIVALLGPKIGGPIVGKFDPADPLDLLDAVFCRRSEPQRRTVVGVSGWPFIS